MILSVTVIPLSLGTLTLLKWVDEHGCKKSFKLPDKISMEWRKIGVVLGREMGQLDGFHIQYSHIASQCWCRVITDWLDNSGTCDYPATWEGLFELLQDVDKYEVAVELENAVFSVALTVIPPSHCLWPDQLSSPFLLPVRPHPFLLQKPQQRPLMYLYVACTNQSTLGYQLL